MTDREAAAARLYWHARGEAIFVLLVWALALVWVVGWCYLFGYTHTPESWLVRMGLVQPRPVGEFTYYAGFPDWVFFGILVPWLVCSAVTIVFALVGMKDDDLGAEAEETVHVGH